MNHMQMAKLFHKTGELKRIIRSGWLRQQIPEPESVADHCFRTVFMAMVFGEAQEVDAHKLLKMAVIHDLAEVVAGDITPHNGISREEKLKKEEEGLGKLLEGISEKEVYLDLFREYGEQESREAKLLGNIDKLEMAFTASEYKRMFPDKDLGEFISEAKSKINNAEVRSILNQI